MARSPGATVGEPAPAPQAARSAGERPAAGPPTDPALDTSGAAGLRYRQRVGTILFSQADPRF